MSDPAQQPPTPPTPPATPVPPASVPAGPPSAPVSPAEPPQGWAPPSAAPFGAPAPAAPAAPTGHAHGGHAAAPGYAPPQGYAAPAGYGAASGAASASGVPTAAPAYGSPAYGSPAYGTPAYGFAAPAPRTRKLGFVALMLALAATVGATLVGAIATFTVALGAPGAIDYLQSDFDWSTLTPVRGWVLVAELAFWAGTILGIWALVQGIVAAVTARGRATGIAAIVVAAVGPVVFYLVAVVALVAGATGSSL